MIATRLHAKRHSNLASKRPSVASIPSSVHFHTHQQLRRASKRPSHDIQNIDSDEHPDDDDDDDDKEVHERVKVDVRFLLACRLESSASPCVAGSRGKPWSMLSRLS